eukprot:1426031-Pyramimonas_sp.AAC.1
MSVPAAPTSGGPHTGRVACQGPRDPASQRGRSPLGTVAPGPYFPDRAGGAHPRQSGFLSAQHAVLCDAHVAIVRPWAGPRGAIAFGPVHCHLLGTGVPHWIRARRLG